MRDECNVVCVSVNSYQDAWIQFVTLFKKYWPDCPFLKFLVVDKAEYLKYELDPFLFFQHEDNRWAKRLLRFIETMRPKSILLLHEDYFLMSPVREQRIEEALRIMTVYDSGFVRLYPCPGSDIESGSPDWGEISNEAPYKASCQAAIWNPEYLKEILKQVNTSPEFELLGTPIARKLPQRCYSFKREAKDWPIEYYCTAIVQGKWQRGALNLCRQEGIEVDLSRRPIDESAL